MTKMTPRRQLLADAEPLKNGSVIEMMAVRDVNQSKEEEEKVGI